MRLLASLFFWFLPLTPQAIDRCCTLQFEVRTNGQAVSGAVIHVQSGAIQLKAQTGIDGRVDLVLRTPGVYTINAATDEVRSAEQVVEIARDQTLRVVLVLSDIGSRRDTVTVEERPSPLEAGKAATSASGNEIKSLPQRVADVRNALPLLPGILRTPEGKLRIAGAPEYRSTFLINSIDVTDPATGSFGPGTPIDVVETLQVYKSPFLAEFGRFSALELDAGPEARGAGDVDFQIRSLRDNLARAGGVASAAVADGLPLDFRGRGTTVSLQSEANGAPTLIRVQVTRVGDGYLNTMGIPLLTGRDFSGDDSAGAEQVTIITKPLADRLFPNGGTGEAIGKRLTFGAAAGDTPPQTLTIIGVTGDFPLPR